MAATFGLGVLVLLLLIALAVPIGFALGLGGVLSLGMLVPTGTIEASCPRSSATHLRATCS